MKIVHVVYSLNPGGIESFLLQLTKRLPEKEIETHIFSFHSGTLQPQFGQIAKLHFFGTIWSPVTWIEIFKEFKALAPASIHCHVGVVSALITILSRVLHIPCFFYIHSMPALKLKLRKPIYFAIEYLSIFVTRIYMTRGFGVSEQACRYIGGSNYSSRKISRFQLGIDFSRYAPTTDVAESSQLRSTLSIPPDAIVIANVAGYRPQKNYAFFIDVAAELLKRDLSLYFLMVGEGVERTTMEQRIRQHNIASHCILCGYRDDVPKLLTSVCNFLLFPSIHEGLGLALVEAQAAGLLCYYSDNVPPEAVINRSLAHPLALSDGVVSWAEKMEQEISKYRSNAVDRHEAYKIAVNSNYNIDRVTAAFVQLCKQENEKSPKVTTS